MYRSSVLPHHRRFYEEMFPGAARGIHLCGSVMRHMKTIRDELGVTSFDTGYPVDFKRVREELGPDVEIHGGPRVSLLLDGSPRDVYEETCRILESGVKEGGRFVLREANNLPPRVPQKNLAAMYRACLDKGWY
jgi:uroporphyrinogen-III decarboxylase